MSQLNDSQKKGTKMKTILFLIALFAVSTLGVSTLAFAYGYNQEWNSPNTTFYTPTGGGGYMATSSYGGQTFYQPAGNGNFMAYSDYSGN